jgi:hypothetical protein
LNSFIGIYWCFLCLISEIENTFSNWRSIFLYCNRSGAFVLFEIKETVDIAQKKNQREQNYFEPRFYNTDFNMSVVEHYIAHMRYVGVCADIYSNFFYNI